MADHPTPEAAQAKRDEIIANLRACTCLYPLVVFRNGSGHHMKCPAYVARATTVIHHESGGTYT